MPKSAPKKSLFSPEYDAFVKALRQARLDAGLTQAQVAAKLGRRQTFVSKCESGERRVDVVELLRFCQAYEIAPSEFIQRLQASHGSR